MGHVKSKIIVCMALLLIVVFGMVGCAGTKGSYTPVKPVTGGADFAKYSNLALEVNNNPDVALSASDKERIKTQIIANIRKDYSTRFKEINANNMEPPTLQAIVNVTRYDKGSAFARFMLAGLGAMHVDSDVTLNDLGTGQCLGKSECKKTFAWGGMYGGSTKIEDIEEGFAKAVAASIVEAK